jgi:hypothetical protein
MPARRGRRPASVTLRKLLDAPVLARLSHRSRSRALVRSRTRAGRAPRHRRAAFTAARGRSPRNAHRSRAAARAGTGAAPGCDGPRARHGRAARDRPHARRVDRRQPARGVRRRLVGPLASGFRVPWLPAGARRALSRLRPGAARQPRERALAATGRQRLPRPPEHHALFLARLRRQRQPALRRQEPGRRQHALSPEPRAARQRQRARAVADRHARQPGARLDARRLCKRAGGRGGGRLPEG